MRGAGKYLDYLGAQAHVVPACELCVTTAGLHTLAALPVHPLSTDRATAARAEVQMVQHVFVQTDFRNCYLVTLHV